MDITFISQLVNATVGIDTVAVINEYHISELIARDFDPIVAFECRNDWEVTSLPVTKPLSERDFRAEVEKLKSELISLRSRNSEKLQRLRAKSQLL